MLGNHSSSRTTTNAKANQKFWQARLVAAVAWPYLAGAVMRLCPRWSKEVPTMAVDGYWRLYMNDDWVAEQHPCKLALVLAGHELFHVLGNHSERLTAYRDVFIKTPDGFRCTVANCAHDLAINCGLKSFVDSATALRKAAGESIFPMAVPAEALAPEMFIGKGGKCLPRGLISEGYAELLMSEAQKSPQCGKRDKGSGKGEPGEGGGSGKGEKPKAGSGQCGSGGGGEKGSYEDRSEPDTSDPNSGVCEAEQDLVRVGVAQAVREQAAKDRGTVPGGLSLWAEIFLKPSKVPWDQLLRRKTRATMTRIRGQFDYTYSRPNRRNRADGLVLPGMYSPEPCFGVALDTSGSMGSDDYAEAFGHIAAVLRSVSYRKVPVFCCDARSSEIQWVDDVKKIKMVGGGGTDMGAAIRTASESRKMKLLIVLTDGITPWGSKPDGMDVIVALTQPESSYPVPDWATKIVCQD